jgi:hypothetical protein
MHISQLKESKFLKKEDVGSGVLLTIAKVFEENVAKEGVAPDMKWCVEFSEADKPMVLNSTNGQLIAQITGSEDSDGWIGRKVVLYTDPSITFGGKLVGGIRVRAPKGKAAQPAAAPATPPPSVQKAINEDRPSPVVAAASMLPSEDPASEDDVPF